MQFRLKPIHAAIVGGLLLIGWPYLQRAVRAPAAVPVAPESAEAANLAAKVKAALVGPAAKQDAVKLSALYAGLADALEFDGKLTTPQIKTTDHVKRLQDVARVYALDGATFAEKYPAMIQIVGDTLKAAVGDDVAPLDNAARAKAVAAYRSLAQAIGRAG